MSILKSAAVMIEVEVVCCYKSGSNENILHYDTSNMFKAYINKKQISCPLFGIK